MKAETVKPRSMRIIAAVCAVVIIAGGSAGINMLRTEATAQEAPEDKSTEKNTSEKKDDGIISAGGTVTSEYLSDELGMKDTAVRLTVGEVLAEAGDTVTAGTPLYQITSESLEKAEKTLRSELQSARNALLEQTASYRIEQGKANSLYESELLLGTTARTEYNSGVSSLYGDLQDAYDAYNDAVNTINDTPSQITDKQTELDEKQKTADGLQEKTDAAREELDKAKEKYSSAAESYNAAVTELNSSASAARYLGNYLGSDTSEIVNAQTVSVQPSEQNAPSGEKMPEGQDGAKNAAQTDNDRKTADGARPSDSAVKAADKTGSGSSSAGTLPSTVPAAADKTTDGTKAKLAVQSKNAQNTEPDTELDTETNTAADTPSVTETENPQGGEDNAPTDAPKTGKDDYPSNISGDFPSGGGKPSRDGAGSGGFPDFDMQGKDMDKDGLPKEEVNEEEIALSAITALYEQALDEYNTLKEKLTAQQELLTSAEKEYAELSEKLAESETELKEAQNEISALEKEISELESSLSKAKSSVNELKKNYTSLSASYNADLLELKNKLDTDSAAYENAEYHYKITNATLDDELEKAQTAYDTAAENLRIFEEELADGYIKAGRDGTVYSLSFKEGRNADIGSPFVYYVDSSRFETTVELDQTDVTQVSIGDSVIIYSSETGVTNGRITAISAGTQKSLADVRFNVTVAADEGAALYSGQSVNVYFNYSGMAGGFTDFDGKSGDGKGGSFEPSGDFPNFGGGSPEGFDMSAMPDFGRRKED